MERRKNATVRLTKGELALAEALRRTVGERSVAALMRSLLRSAAAARGLVIAQPDESMHNALPRGQCA